MSEIAKLVPELVYDLIGRMISGLALIVTAYFALRDSSGIERDFTQLAAQATVEHFPWVTILVLISLGGYVLSFVLNGLYVLFPLGDNLRNDLAKIRIKDYGFYSYLVKLSGEAHMCRVLFLGWTILLILILSMMIFDFSQVSQKDVVIGIALIFAIYSTRKGARHYVDRLGGEVVNWKRITEATPIKAQVPPEPVTGQVKN